MDGFLSSLAPAYPYIGWTDWERQVKSSQLKIEPGALFNAIFLQHPNCESSIQAFIFSGVLKLSS
jgi:hypothetical protein